MSAVTTPSRPPLSAVWIIFMVFWPAYLFPHVPMTVCISHTCPGEVLSNHCLILSLSFSKLSRDFSSYSNPNLSMALRSYVTRFLFYFSDPTFNHCSPCSLYFHYPGLLVAFARHDPVQKPLQSLQPQPRMPLLPHPHGSPSYYFQVFVLFRSHFIREVFPVHPAKRATALQYSLGFFIFIYDTWHHLTYYLLIYSLSTPPSEMEAP